MVNRYIPKVEPLFPAIARALPVVFPDRALVGDAIIPGVTRLCWLTDPGHAWLVVPRALVHDVLGPVHGGMGLISAYSFQVTLPNVGPVFLLEEDCDAGLFLAAWDAQPVLGARELWGIDVEDTLPAIRDLPSVAVPYLDRATRERVFGDAMRGPGFLAQWVGA